MAIAVSINGSPDRAIFMLWCGAHNVNSLTPAGFQVPAGVAIPPPLAAGSLAAGAEDDGMPKEDPSKLERAPGEENEEVCIRNPSLEGRTEAHIAGL